MPKVDRLFSLLLAIFDPVLDALRFIRLSLQQRCTLAAENLFLRKQLALYLERHVEPRRPRAAAKLTLVLLSRVFPWRQALTIVKPDTFVRWRQIGHFPQAHPLLAFFLCFTTVKDNGPSDGQSKTL